MDLAKGVCIILVCIHHSFISNIMPEQFRLLRIPLYIILSGLFFKDYGGIINFTEKKINKILIPAVAFYTIGFLLAHFYAYLHLTDPVSYSYWDILHNKCHFDNPVWFLFCLFEINVLFCIISLLCRGNKLFIGIICGCCAIAGYLLSSYELHLFYLDSTMTAIPFFYVGFIVKNSGMLYHTKYDTYMFFGGIIMFAGVLLLDAQFDTKNRIDLWNNGIYGNPVLGYLFSIILVIATLLILKKIKWLPIISYFGRYSIMVLVIHGFFLTITGKVFNNYHHSIMLFATLILSWISIPFLKEYFPFITAQKDIIRVKK